MPQSITLAVFLLGGVLLLLALSAGGFKIFGAEMSGASGLWSRLAAGVVGLGLIGAGAFDWLKPQGEPVGLMASPRVEIGKPDAALAAGVEAPVKDNGHPVSSSSAPPDPKLFSVPQKFNVACDSEGQVCDHSAHVAGPFPEFLTIGPVGGCSKVKYTVTFQHRGSGLTVEEGASATTKPLGPDETHTLRVEPGALSAEISAEGVLGDCNQGRLASWNVLVVRGGA